MQRFASQGQPDRHDHRSYSSRQGCLWRWLGCHGLSPLWRDRGCDDCRHRRRSSRWSNRESPITQTFPDNLVNVSLTRRVTENGCTSSFRAPRQAQPDSADRGGARQRGRLRRHQFPQEHKHVSSMCWAMLAVRVSYGDECVVSSLRRSVTAVKAWQQVSNRQSEYSGSKIVLVQPKSMAFDEYTYELA